MSRSDKKKKKKGQQKLNGQLYNGCMKAEGGCHGAQEL